jgi:outer membrane protein assembly factor BamA
MIRLAGLTLLISLSAVSAALAQDPATRAEADRQRREEKAGEVRPYEPSGLERAMAFAEDKAIFIVDREGFYPKLGSLTTGSGFAYGIGFRDRDLFENKGSFDIWTAGSTRRYWAAEARLTFPELLGRRLLLETWISRRDYPKENFYGLGPDADRDDRSDYALRTDFFGGRAGFRPISFALVGGGVEYQTPVVGSGRDEGVPNVEDVFEPEDVPGFGDSANFLRTNLFVEIDYRKPKNARQGGWYRFDFANYDDRSAGLYNFNRYDADVRQFFGFLAGRRVVALRLAASTSTTDDGDVMPFYYMRTLGGNDTLRGFREYRFRGPHAILTQAEYRWEIWSGLDAAVFYDAGKVADRRADLNFADLESDYGFGFRFNTDSAIIFRVDAGFGSRDGKHLYIVWGGVF